MAAGTMLKSLFPKLFHVTCVAYLLHKYAMKFKSQFEDVDKLIPKVKSASVKNQTRQAKFATIQTQPIGSRWESWLNAALYYGKNLPTVKMIVESFEGSGILAAQANASLETIGLATQLFKIKDQYECRVKLVETIERGKYSIKEAVQAIHEHDFGEDSALAVTFKKYAKR